MLLFPTLVQSGVRASYLVEYDNDWFPLWAWFNGDAIFLELLPSVNPKVRLEGPSVLFILAY